MESQFGKTFEVERKPEPDGSRMKDSHYILMRWDDPTNGPDNACFDPDKARELGQALIDSADNVKRCRCGRTV